MANQFYVTLPSNTDVENTPASFQIKLPRNIVLNGEWEVGLSEIIYANTWHNVSKFQNSMSFFDEAANRKLRLTIPAARYSTITDLVDTIAKTIKRRFPEYLESIKLTYNEFSKVCELTIDGANISYFSFSRHLLYMLGFDENLWVNYNKGKILHVKAPHPPDMLGGMHYLLIYCDVAEPQIVGHTLAPLLQVVNVEGKYMEIINHSYVIPHYVPVLKKSFNTIEINIKNDTDEPVPFEFGKTIIKLHFRRSTA